LINVAPFNHFILQLDISDLYYHMASVGKIKVMLKDINLQIKSGEMCAIMGPTGSGKSTLLELTANRKIAGFWCGEVLINKKPRPEWFQQISACEFN
jgi:ATP-binding cassette subfamily G (WHITE) protein 2